MAVPKKQRHEEAAKKQRTAQEERHQKVPGFMDGGRVPYVPTREEFWEAITNSENFNGGEGPRRWAPHGDDEAQDEELRDAVENADEGWDDGRPGGSLRGLQFGAMPESYGPRGPAEPWEPEGDGQTAAGTTTGAGGAGTAAACATTGAEGMAR